MIIVPSPTSDAMLLYAVMQYRHVTDNKFRVQISGVPGGNRKWGHVCIATMLSDFDWISYPALFKTAPLSHPDPNSIVRPYSVAQMRPVSFENRWRIIYPTDDGLKDFQVEFVNSDHNIIISAYRRASKAYCNGGKEC